MARTATVIRYCDRIATGPVIGRNFGTVSRIASRRATENPAA